MAYGPCALHFADYFIEAAAVITRRRISPFLIYNIAEARMAISRHSDTSADGALAVR